MKIMTKIIHVLAPAVTAAVIGAASGEDQPRAAAAAAAPVAASGDRAQDAGLVGHWKLQGDCRDHSGKNNHGVNHGVALETGTFDGVGAYIEVPSRPSLKFGTGDFAISARIHTEREPNDVLGDVLDLYDPDLRRGITLSLKSSAGGYQSQGTDQHVCFGIDNARTSEWKDCGRPSRTSNYVA